jgi:selenocysteine-specific translation elongation factor
MVELGIPELSTEQIELLCQTAEDAARKYVFSKVSNKQVDRLDISVEADGTKPVNVTVEIDLALSLQVKDVDAESLVKAAEMRRIKPLKIFEKDKMTFKQILQLLQENNALFVLLLCHRSADADGFAQHILLGLQAVHA